MKIIHIESGLGNQMLSYCEYLALKKMNPDDDFYLETIIYDIPECNDTICQWNGYELERIFGIDSPKNIKTFFSTNEWNQIIAEVRETKFWTHNWNYPIAITTVLNKHGMKLENIRGNFERKHCVPMTDDSRKSTIRTRITDSMLGATLRRYYRSLCSQKYIKMNDKRSLLFLKTTKDIFTGQWLSFKFIGNERWRIDKEIRDSFVFPAFIDRRNQEMSDLLSNCNSVAIHARRGDMLSVNGWCYKYGYFQRAVKHIRKNVENPVFVFFTNTGSVDWCKENAAVFGLDFNKDKVLFVDWNMGDESFRDMQLMSYCKHAIITNSSFGWWGAFFIKNMGKITISPLVEMDTTYHC